MSDIKPRRISFWLVSSILLNMALIGLVAGLVMPKPHQGRHDRPDPQGTVSAEDRAAVRSVMVDIMKESRDTFEGRREARKALSAAMTAEPYSPDAVRNAFATFRAEDVKMRESLDDALADRLVELTPQQRALVVEIIARERHPRGERRGRGDR